MRSLLIAGSSFGAAGLELAEAGLLILLLLRAGYRRAPVVGAAVAAAVVAVAALLVGVPVLAQIPVTGLRLYLGLALIGTGLFLWARALLHPAGAAAEAEREAEGVRRLARSSFFAGVAAAKVMAIEGSEAAVLTVAIGAPSNQLAPAAAGTAVAALTVVLLVWRGERLLAGLAGRVLDKVAGSAVLVAGSFWVADASGAPWLVGVAVLLVAVLWFLARLRADPLPSAPRSPA